MLSSQTFWRKYWICNLSPTGPRKYKVWQKSIFGKLWFSFPILALQNALANWFEHQKHMFCTKFKLWTLPESEREFANWNSEEKIEIEFLRKDPLLLLQLPVLLLFRKLSKIFCEYLIWRCLILRYLILRCLILT